MCVVTIDEDRDETRKDCAAVLAEAGLRLGRVRLAREIALTLAETPKGGRAPLVVVIGETVSWTARSIGSHRLVDRVPVGTKTLCSWACGIPTVEPDTMPAVHGGPDAGRIANAERVFGREIELLLRILAEEHQVPRPDRILLVGSASERPALRQAVRVRAGCPVERMRGSALEIPWALAATSLWYPPLSEHHERPTDLSTVVPSRSDKRESSLSAGVSAV